MTNEEQKLREIAEQMREILERHNGMTFLNISGCVSDLTALISEDYVDKDIHDRLVKRADELTTELEELKLKYDKALQQRDELLKALSILLHLHYCEQEGIGAGQPTPEQWFKAVEYAEGVVQKAEAAIKNTDG